MSVKIHMKIKLEKKKETIYFFMVGCQRKVVVKKHLLRHNINSHIYFIYMSFTKDE